MTHESGTTERLITKWQLEISDLPVPTWTEPWCLAYCAEKASQSDFAVEVGTFMGMSALVMLRANPRLHLWCVDIFSAFEFNKQLVEYFLKDYIKQGRCELIKGTSDKAAEMLFHMSGRLDSVWVDGSHATVDVLKDIKNLYPLIRNGGEIYGHDFDSNPFNDVAQAVMQCGLPYTIPVPRLWSIPK